MPQRKAGREWLRHRNDVRLDSIMLIGEVLPGAAQPALDFVENQQRAGAIAQLSRSLQELRAERPDSALALNRLQANGADAAIKLPLQVVDVIEPTKPTPGTSGANG